MADKHVAQIFFQALLDHQRHARNQGTPKTADRYPKGFCIAYGDLVKRSGLDVNPVNVGGYLYQVAEKCVALGWPPLHALAVNRNSGVPGPGFFRAPGTTIEDFDPVEWENCVLECIAFQGFPKSAPPLQ